MYRDVKFQKTKRCEQNSLVLTEEEEQLRYEFLEILFYFYSFFKKKKK